MKLDTSHLVVIMIKFNTDSGTRYKEVLGVVVSPKTILTIPPATIMDSGGSDMKLYIVSDESYKVRYELSPVTDYTVTNSNDNKLSMITLIKDITDIDISLTTGNLGVVGSKSIYRIPIFKNGNWYPRRVEKISEDSDFIYVRRLTKTENIFGSPVIDGNDNIIGLTRTDNDIYTCIIPFNAERLNWIYSFGDDNQYSTDSDEIPDEILEDMYSKSINPDYVVNYATEEDDLITSTGFDLPDRELEFRELTIDTKNVSGNYSKESDKYAESVKSVTTSLYDKLFPKKNLIDYLNVPISHNVLDTLRNSIHSNDPRISLLISNLNTYSDLLKWIVNFRWSRFNILDKYMSFTDYMDFVSSVVSGLKVPNDFPVLITKNTVNKMRIDRYYCCPHTVDYKSKSIVYTSGDYTALMDTEYGKISSKSINLINMSCYTDKDWLITNKSTSIEFKSLDNTVKTINTGYTIMSITGLEYKDNYIIIYLISGYTEHTLILDYDFNLLEDKISEVFTEDIVKLLDPKSYIFRDKYQYYVNDNNGKFVTFPLINMMDMYNRLINKFTIVNTELVDPRPVTIMNNGPRINSKYGKIYNVMWAYTDSVSMMTILPAIGYSFDKNDFYNPRKYLVNADYDESCIPLHKGFVRTEIYPWFWNRNGLIWHNGYYGYNNYYGLYYSYWNNYWWFFN